MKQPTPPRLFQRLLSKMFSNTPMEELEGDLLDDFHRNIEKYGTYRAKLYFMFDVLRLVRLVPRSRRNTQNSKTMNNSFLFNLKYSLRSIKKHRVYQSLNIASLTLGFTCFSLIYLFVFNHYQKDSSLTERENIVRLNIIIDGKEKMGIHTGIPSLLTNDFAEVEAFTRISAYNMDVTIAGSQEVFNERVISAESGLMDIFQIQTIAGQRFPQDATGVLLSESLAIKLFSSVDNALGQELSLTIYERESKKLVSGIFKDLPINSSFQGQIITQETNVNDRTSNLMGNRAWMSLGVFFKVRPNTDLEALAERIPRHLKAHTTIESLTTSKYVFRTYDEVKNNPSISDGFIQSVDAKTMLIFKLVGLVVLLLAIANYVNLTTALTLKRTQEVGIKHAMGASKRNLISQMLSEAIIIGTISIILSALLTTSLLKPIEAYIGLSMQIAPSFKPWIPFIGIGALLTLIVISSLYPAILFSTVKFNQLLKGNISSSPKSKWLRSGLMALQFCISTFLIIGSLTFVKQLRFIDSSHKVEQIGNVVILKGRIGDQRPVIEQKLKSIPDIEKLSFSSVAPGPEDNMRGGMGTKDFEKQMDFYVIDSHFLEIMGLKVTEGVNFFDDDRNSKYHVLLNEAAAEIAVDGNPLNKEFNLMAKEPSKIIGIVENFPVGSIKSEVKPSIYLQAEQSNYLPQMVNKVAIKMNTTDPIKAIEKIESAWNEVYPDQPFEAEFMDDRISKIYTDEVKMGQLFGAFTGVAVVISCLGLIGLLTYLVQIKMKEIGIRKVLGANFSTLAKLLTLNIWKVLALASLISFPLSYYFLQDWLTSFAYRTSVSAELFILTLVFFVLIVSAAIFWQIRNAVRINPSEVLRNE